MEQKEKLEWVLTFDTMYSKAIFKFKNIYTKITNHSEIRR